MFYEYQPFRPESSSKLESALVVLTPSESKRLIAKAIAVMPEVKSVLEKGLLVIGMGTTNAYVVEEILGSSIDHKSHFCSGVVSEGELRGNSPDTKILPFVLQDGAVSKLTQWEALSNFEPSDVFVKGANAVDPAGNVGILVAGQTGGSVGDAWFAITGCGGQFICPVGLEKLIPSVEEASQKCGIFRFKYSMGLPVSLIPFPTARVITEIQAISLLTGADSTLVASGGIGGSEGAVILAVEGKESVLEKAFDVIRSVKNEPQIAPPEKYASPPAAALNYDARALTRTIQFTVQDPRIYSRLYEKK